MLFLRRAFLFVIVTLVFAAFPTRAQHEGSTSDTANDATPYVPPPASKSVEIGNFYLKKRKYAAALSRFQEAVRTDPYFAPAYLGLGKVYEKIGLNLKALQAYQKYLDTLPSAKDAAEARDAQNAIARLKRKLKITGASTRVQSQATTSAHAH